ncbi:bifunctional DNA primase/polymerase [Jiangella alkaliphila]|uniref:Bifunctional DNA primase/polymerase, N-terminal n=1 Tax=Jiangella alkaliphila TaxID=419479 RepID=A0A1H2GB76_9ACTN|nr:bifunctional DNA primase/polymerase [Jiangella alkaliphila]SDU16976.1 Bifunctional DNA primase/polymerase, N-terminal [Jiangella alkaliphila]
MTDRDTMGAAALSYAAAGIAVFPCWPLRKRPLVKDGFYAATTDPDRIRAWWARWPAANVAMPTGQPHWDVVDVDVKNGAPGYATLRRLRAAGLVDGWSHAVVTPSRGLHLYFAGTAQPSGSNPAHGLDFRGLGGYVLVPPSRVHLVGTHGSYQTIDICDAHRASTVGWEAIRTHLAPPHRPTPARVTADVASDAERRLTYLIRHVETRPDGQRHPGLLWAAHRAVDNGSTDLAPLVAAAVRAGLPEDEAEAVVTHVADRRGVSGRSSTRAL